MTLSLDSDEPVGISTAISINNSPNSEPCITSSTVLNPDNSSDPEALRKQKNFSLFEKETDSQYNSSHLPSSTSFSSPPINKTLEILAVAWHVYSIPVILSLFLLCCAFPPFWPVVSVYLIYFFLDKGSENGSAPDRSSILLRASPVWKYFANYFPIVLHKTCELEPAFIINKEEQDYSRQLDQDDISFSQDDDINSDQASQHQQSTIAKKRRVLSSIDNKDDSTAYTDDEKDNKQFSKEAFKDKNGDHVQYPECNRPPTPNILASSSKFEDDVGKYNHRLLGLRRFFLDIIRWLWAVFSIKREPSQKKRTGRQYIFGYHPHGIIGMGAVGGIATEGAHWSKLFPGVPVTTLTLVNQFQLPLYREYLLSLGLACVSKRSCLNLLKRGQSICILLGGAQESLLARPGYMDLVLNKRQGFIKLAMKIPGTSVVPVIAFGENNLYDQIQNDPNSWLYNIQTYLKNTLGFTLPLIHARGIFNYDFGIIPYRRPINIVVGKPIEIPHIEDPTPEEIASYHLIYVQSLKDLFEEHKDQFHNSQVLNDGIDYQDLRIME